MDKLRLATLDGAAVEALNSASLGEPSNATLDAQVVTQDRIADLAALSGVDYDRQRSAAAKELGIRKTTLDQHVSRHRSSAGAEQPVSVVFPQREKWPEPVENISEVLDEVSAEILEFMAMARYWGDVTALWCLHTYMVDAFAVSPRYAAESPTSECGKSTLLSIIKELACRPLKTSNIQPAGVFRVVNQYSPTLIIDEGDTFLHANDPLRGILDSGHAKGDCIRVEGDPLMPRAYHVFGACAFGLIGELPPTLQNRSIVNRLKRATREEIGRLKTFRTDRPPEALRQAAAKLWRWAEDNRSELDEAADLDMVGLINRAADNWRGLFIIADRVGGDWPKRIRDAALMVSRGVADQLPLNIELLADIRGIVCDAEGRDKLGSVGSNELLAVLVGMDSRPWADWRAGRPMTTTTLAGQLRPFGIFPDPGRVRRGYIVEHMLDAFARYLPPSPSQPVNMSQT